jgi:hypothetical protein
VSPTHLVWYKENVVWSIHVVGIFLFYAYIVFLAWSIWTELQLTSTVLCLECITVYSVLVFIIFPYQRSYIVIKLELLALVQALPLHCKKNGFALFYIGALLSLFDIFELFFAGMYLDVYCIKFKTFRKWIVRLFFPDNVTLWLQAVRWQVTVPWKIKANYFKPSFSVPSTVIEWGFIVLYLGRSLLCWNKSAFFYNSTHFSCMCECWH